MNFALIISVAIGGSIGAVMRFVGSAYVNKLIGSTFPFGTLSVNILGSFIIGFLALYFEQTISANLKAMLITGMLGALTTFSTFSLETILMLQQSLYLKAFLNVALNITLTLSATILGMALFKKLYGV
jgi:CrcB protein